MIDTLIKLGFRKNDALVYQALIELGPSFVAPIVRQTKKHRQIVYNSLNFLLEKDLIKVAQKNGKNFYSVSDPERIMVQIRQSEVEAENLIKQIISLQKVEKEHAEVFIGTDSYERGTMDFRRNAFESGEYLVIRGDTKGWFEQTRFFFNKHVEELKKMKRQGVDVMIAFFEKDKDLAVKFMGPYLGSVYTAKLISEDYRFPHTVWLAGEHVYFVTPASDPIVVHIKSKNLADKYKEYFWHLWSKGKLLEG